MEQVAETVRTWLSCLHVWHLVASTMVVKTVSLVVTPRPLAPDKI